MFEIYAVVLVRDDKRRELIGREEDESIARRCAQGAVCRQARYAYVKDTVGGTIFLIPGPGRPAAGTVLPHARPTLDP